MTKKIILFPALFLVLCAVLFAQDAKAQTSSRRNFSERFVLQSVRSVFSAEVTYQATLGAGTFGSLAQLQQASMIDAVLASGEKYRYVYVLQAMPPTAGTPARFFLTATPRSYPKSGRRSFYISETGELRGADKNGGVADQNDPIIDDCASMGVFFNERCAILDMVAVRSAEMTYASTVGNGNFGGLSELFAAGLINSRLASGTNHGYNYVLTTITQAPGVPPFFKFQAVPTNYGVTGRRSFYVDSNLIIRGADRQGQPADENDPPIND